MENAAYQVKHMKAKLLIALCCFWFCAAANANQVFSGQLPSGGYYKIEAPDNWRAGDSVVLFQHGFSMSPPSSNVDLGPLKEVQISQGFAVAATSYRMRGWALFKSSEDNLELLDAITNKIGAPGDLYTFGGSMGGLIAIKMAEHPQLINKVKAVYSVCGATGGARVWDQALDVRLIYDAVCAGVGGGELPKGDAPLSWATNLDDIPDGLGSVQSTDELARLAARMNQCFGYGLNDLLRSSAQKERRAKLFNLTGVSEENWLAAQIGYAAFALGDLIRDPQKLASTSSLRSVLTVDARLSNNHLMTPAAGKVVYCDLNGDPNNTACAVPLEVESVLEDRDAAYQLARVSNLNGQATAPILSLHTSKDQLVSANNQAVLRNKYRAANLSSVLINESTSTHCGFSDAELETGWNALRAWRGNGIRPLFSSLQNSCVQNNSTPNQCRFSNLEPLALQHSIRERLNIFPNRISGAWWNSQRSGEGIFLEEIDGLLGTADGPPRKVLLTYYTYDGTPRGANPQPPASEPRGQSWLLGVGDVYGNGIHFPLIQDTQGARFGNLFRPQDVQLSNWGKIDLAFGFSSWPNSMSSWLNSIQQMSIKFEFLGDEILDVPSTMEQLTFLGAPRIHLDRTLEPLATRAQTDARSGTYYNLNRAGEGITLSQFGPRSAFTFSPLPNPDLRALLVWYTYDNSGKQMWLIGEGIDINGRLRFDMLRTIGETFAAGFDPNQIQRIPWGVIELEVSRCEVVALNYQAIDPSFGNGRISLSRLTYPVPFVPESCVYP